MTRSDDKKDFTTLGIGGGSDPSTDDVAPDDIDTFGTLGLGAIPLKGARRADKPESDKGDEGEKSAPAPIPQSDRIQELRRQRNAQIQAFLAQAESALAEDRLEESRAAIEQAVLLSPDNSKVMSMLEAVEQAEQARLEAERARHRAEEARRKAEQARAISTKPTVQATPRAGGPVRDDSAASEGVAASGAAGLLFASGADQEQPRGEERPSSLGDLRLGDVRVLAGLGVGGVIMVVLILSLLMGGSDDPPVTTSRESVPPATPSLPPPPPGQPLAGEADAGNTLEREASLEPPRRTAPRSASRSFSSVASPATRPTRTTASATVERSEPTRAAPPPREPPAEASSPPPPAPARATPDGPVRIAGDIPRPTRTTNVPPTYPAEAREAGVQGIVVFETVIGASGQVTDVRVLRSVDPRIDAAALAAVRQWAYTPTVIDGAAVPVVMTETVRFRLDGPTEGIAPSQAQRSTSPSQRAPAAPASSGSTGAVRIAGDIPRPTRTADVAPEYPDAAIQARVAGIVILETEIGATGQVTNVKILRSADPLLDQAAVAAARQWIYTSTVLEGKAVPVVMTETVNFVLPPSMDDIDPRTLLGLSMEQVRNRVGSPRTGDDTIWTYQTAKGQVTLTFATPADGSPGDALVTRVQSPQGTVRRLPR